MRFLKSVVGWLAIICLLGSGYVLLVMYPRDVGVFGPSSEEPDSYLKAGQRIRFRPIGAEEFENYPHH